MRSQEISYSPGGEWASLFWKIILRIRFLFSKLFVSWFYHAIWKQFSVGFWRWRSPISCRFQSLPLFRKTLNSAKMAFSLLHSVFIVMLSTLVVEAMLGCVMIPAAAAWRGHPAANHCQGPSTCHTLLGTIRHLTSRNSSLTLSLLAVPSHLLFWARGGPGRSWGHDSKCHPFLKKVSRPLAPTLGLFSVVEF